MGKENTIKQIKILRLKKQGLIKLKSDKIIFVYGEFIPKLILKLKWTAFSFFFY